MTTTDTQPDREVLDLCYHYGPRRPGMAKAILALVEKRVREALEAAAKQAKGTV